MPLQSTLGTLDSGIAVHSYTGIQMWISCTLGLQSIAQTCRQTINCFGLWCFTAKKKRKNGIIFAPARLVCVHPCQNCGRDAVVEPMLVPSPFSASHAPFCTLLLFQRMSDESGISIRALGIAFVVPQHLVPGINRFRKSIGFVR